MEEPMKNMRYILLSEKHWHRPLFEQLREEIEAEWLLIQTKDKFTLDRLIEFKPNKIFIPHWSYLIPSEIFEGFECILFHMTDLPFGRGGSPLQNLIKRGFTETMISAMRVESGIDTGKIYLKRKLLLNGSALEIFIRASNIIKGMVVEINSSDIQPVAQKGQPVVFKRRTPDQSNIDSIKDINELYDHIRMLDCEGYPAAYIENECFKFEFYRVSFKDTKTLQADVRILQK
jgi:methionyl-tRNA formyltransferase